MEIAFALDHDTDARETFQANFPNAYFEFADIRDISVDAVRLRVEAERPTPVLFSGCAPCQPFTKQNTKRPIFDQDERVPLLDHFGQLVESCRPDLVFVENVPGLQKLDSDSQPFGGFLNRLDAAGYMVDYRPVRLVRYGIPQSRRRLVLVASRHGTIHLPDETHGPGTPSGRYDTVRDWISISRRYGQGRSTRRCQITERRIYPHATWSVSGRHRKAVATEIGRITLSLSAIKDFRVIPMSMGECRGTLLHRDSPPGARAIRMDASAIQNRTGPLVFERPLVCRRSRRTSYSRGVWPRWQGRSETRSPSAWRS